MKKLITKTIEKIASKNVNSASLWYTYQFQKPETLERLAEEEDESSHMLS